MSEETKKSEEKKPKKQKEQSLEERVKFLEDAIIMIAKQTGLPNRLLALKNGETKTPK